MGLQRGAKITSMTIPPDLIARLRSARRVAVLTGVGVSQESGGPEPLFQQIAANHLAGGQ